MKSFAIRLRGVKFLKMSPNTTVLFNFRICRFLKFLPCHRHFHYEGVIKIFVNVSKPTYTTYQQLGIYI